MEPAQIDAENLHREKVVQEHLAAQLVLQQGYFARQPDDHDKALAVDRELLLRFLKETQPEAWEKLVQHYPGRAEATLFTQLDRSLKDRGTLDVLRHGLKLVPNIELRLCFFQPASHLNPELVRLFEANTLSVIQEVAYSARHGNRLDVVLYVNGLPVATLELKNTLTGTTYRHAEKQYREERSPAGEPLLTFKRGALVHFAADQDFVSMTTRLKNGKTRFLPFNRGRDGGAGNPDIVDEFRIAYLYADQPEGKAILSREVLLDVIGKFLHVDGGTLIFPRFHQLDAVRRMMADARVQGAGQNYLIQHSAGSGKSNTIGWTAHQAIKLHTDADEAVFHSVVVVTDRIVLDRQLQKTVSGLEQTKGLVKTIDGTSRQLKAAIEQGAKIIVTTIQKFGTEHLKAISAQRGKRFAVIIDEAHGSQSGRSAQALSRALTADEENSVEEVEDLIAEYQRLRGPQRNISYFAFTATPRNVTLERFGRPGPDGKPRPFHLYTMRQAIEEGFILDVLRNYMTYSAYYKLARAVEEDPELSPRARRKIWKFATLHPETIAEKVAVIVEHFERHVAGEMGGLAKAMIVTASREHALRYFQALKMHLAEEGLPHGALVAFSGDLKLDGETYTEAGLNGFAETELRDKFDGAEYRFLVVAEKYQTGFDQPKLCAMYVDKKLAGLQAVQTLSRLNRTAPGKGETFVLDFANGQEDIKEAFRPFFEVTELEDSSDPNQIYALQQRLLASGFVDTGEIERFAERYYATKEQLTTQDRIALEAVVKLAVQRFEAEEDEGEREEFRQLLRSFQRFYTFLTQVVALEDTSLEKLYGYAAWLSRMLPSREVPPEIEITDDMLQLRALRVQQRESGDASLEAGDTMQLSPIREFGASKYTDEEQKTLQEIIDGFNDAHGTDFTEADFVRFEKVKAEVMDDEMRKMLRNNPPDVSRDAFVNAFYKGAIRAFQRDNEMRNIIMQDKDARDRLFGLMFGRALREAQAAAGAGRPGNE